MTHRTRSHDVDCHVFLCHSVFPIGDNITMLTTADWLLGSNSQSAAGLSTVGANERTILGVLCFLFVSTQLKALIVILNHLLDSWRNLYSLKSPLKIILLFTSCNVIKSPQLLCLSFRNSGTCCYFLWHSVSSMVWHRLDLSSLLVIGRTVNLHISIISIIILNFFNLVVPCWFPEYSGYCVLCDLNASLCMHLPLFFISVLLKRTTLCQHMFLHWASIVETCKTWQQMASSTMRDSTEHDSFAHIVNLFFQKRKKTILQPAWSEMDRFQRILSCQIAVKLSLQIYCWAV